MCIYRYGAWGDNASIFGDQTIAELNPFRYRGYYYDEETGYYYLNSRYYNPEWGRFINADGYVSTGQGMLGTNMFSYCLNCPTSNVDLTGYDPVPLWAKNIVNGTASASDYLTALSINPDSWAGSARYVVDRAIKLAKEHDDMVMGYSEHQKKGTTNKANKNIHEKGQARKRLDNHNEKGDKRRQDRSNKRRPNNIQPEYGVDDKVLSGSIALGASIAIVYLVLNDGTIVGVLDDGAIAALAPIIWDNASIVFS